MKPVCKKRKSMQRKFERTACIQKTTRIGSVVLPILCVFYLCLWRCAAISEGTSSIEISSATANSPNRIFSACRP